MRPSVITLLNLALHKQARRGRRFHPKSFSMLVELLLLTVLVAPVCSAQTANKSRVNNTDALISTLLTDTTIEQPKISELLKEHHDLVTTELWAKLKETAVSAHYDMQPGKSIFIYGIAKEVAIHLKDQKCRCGNAA